MVPQSPRLIRSESWASTHTNPRYIQLLSNKHHRYPLSVRGISSTSPKHPFCITCVRHPLDIHGILEGLPQVLQSISMASTRYHQRTVGRISEKGGHNSKIIFELFACFTFESKSPMSKPSKTSCLGIFRVRLRFF